MENPLISIDSIPDKEVIGWARKDMGVDALIKQDPKTEIYIRRLTVDDVNQIRKAYSDLLPMTQEPIFVVNIISSRMVSDQGYKKIRLYYDTKGNLLNRLETN